MVLNHLIYVIIIYGVVLSESCKDHIALHFFYFLFLGANQAVVYLFI